jgi:type IV secretion system protein VirB9
LPVATDARIKTLIYSPTEVFRLKFHDNYQSYIEFPSKERFKIISVGDYYSWDIKQVGQRLFIRPKQKGVLTNMTIITDKRPYHFEIISSTKELNIVDADLVYVAKFYYPDNNYDYMQAVKLKKPLSKYKSQPLSANLAKASPNFKVPSEASVIESEGAYNYNYSMVGEDKKITPVKIYDDGKDTYFKFATNILPDISYVNKDGSESPAKYLVKDGLVIVKNIALQFSLRNNKSLICIFNNKSSL